MLSSIMILPATCELCGQWMPGHSADCPRSGVHPSQWSLTNNQDHPIVSTENNDNLEETFSFRFRHSWSQPTQDIIFTSDDY